MNYEAWLCCVERTGERIWEIMLRDQVELRALQGAVTPLAAVGRTALQAL
jgi:hypothetical protein